MSENVLLENKTYLYVTSHYFDEKFQPVTSRMVRDGEVKERAEMHVVFCPKCKKMQPYFRTINKDGKFMYTDETYPFSFYNRFDSPIFIPRNYDPAHDGKMICPDCGEELSKYPLKYLEKKAVNVNGSRTLKSLKVFEVQDNKLIASAFMVYYFPNTFVGKLATIPVRHRIVFNLETGQTYFLQGRDLNNKHPKFDSTPEIFNATLGGEIGCCVEIAAITSNKEVVKILAEKLIEARGGKKEQLTKKGDFSDTTFAMLTIYNNIPYFNYDFYYMGSAALHGMYWGDRRPRDRFTYKMRTIKSRYEAGDTELFKKYLFKGTKVEVKKAIRRELFANPLMADYYKFITRAGFKNVDVLRQFLTSGAKFLVGTKTTYDREEEDYQKYMIKFFKALIKAKGEAAACKCLLSAESEDIGRYVRDTALMYVVFNKRKMMKSDYFKGDLVKIHNTLAKDYKKIREVNQKIHYKPEFLKLNDKIDGFSFTLATDTYELIDVGQEMHICVGSYGAQAVRGRCIIVKMMQGQQYVGCIELSGDASSMVQAKACFNNLLEEKKAEALKKWVEKHKIDTHNCYDYSHIAKGEISYDENEIYQGHHDYAGFGFGNIDYDARRIMAEDDHAPVAAVAPDDDWDEYEELPF